jgi:hypothetical protein
MMIELTACLGIFIIIIFLMAYASKKRSNTFIDKFTNKIGMVNGFFIAVGILVTYKLFETNLSYNKRLITLKQVQEGWVDINKLLIDYTNKCPTLIHSFYYDWQKPNSLSFSGSDDFHSCNFIAVNIFQSWENFLTNKLYDKTDDTTWISNFLQFTKSYELKNIWENTKHNYNITTTIFGDLLFSFSEKHTPSNTDEAIQYSKDFIKQKKYQQLIHNVTSS